MFPPAHYAISDKLEPPSINCLKNLTKLKLLNEEEISVSYDEDTLYSVNQLDAQLKRYSNETVIEDVVGLLKSIRPIVKNLIQTIVEDPANIKTKAHEFDATVRSCLCGLEVIKDFELNKMIMEKEEESVDYIQKQFSILNELKERVLKVGEEIKENNQ